MSDQDTDNKKQEEEVASVVPPAAAAPARSSSGLSWLALLLIVALAGVAVWQWQELQKREQQLDQRVSTLETSSGREQSDLDALGERWQSELRSSLDALQESMGSESARLSQAVDGISARLAEQREELDGFNVTDRDSWLLAEVEYLLRLAHQRLIMAGDTTSAQALLENADNVLRDLDDTGMHEVRAAIAADMAAVRAVPKVDVEGIYLRLTALIEQADLLVIFAMPEREEQPAVEPAAGWQDRLRQGYEQALEKLSDYIIIRRRDVPMQALMDPHWEGLVRQNLRMLLEQAQVALLSGNQVLYRESLDRAQLWVAQFLESDESAARAIAREMEQLAELTIAVPLPDISRSVRALEVAIAQRLELGGGE